MSALLDVHTDPDHHRSVLTLVGEEAPRAVTRLAVRPDRHPLASGAHPRIGAVDVVPFVPLGAATMADAIDSPRPVRDVGGRRHSVCLASSTDRSGRCPKSVARRGMRFVPDVGPAQPHPTAGAVAVGARPVLVAYNVWLVEPDLELRDRSAKELRGPAVRTLAFAVGDHVQVSANLVSPLTFGPADLYDAVADRGRRRPRRTRRPAAAVRARTGSRSADGLSSTWPRTRPSRPVSPPPASARLSHPEVGRHGLERPKAAQAVAPPAAAATSRGACPPDPTPLPLAHAAPDPELLAMDQRVLEAVFAHDATSADLLRLARRRAALGKEQIGIDAEAVRVFLPALRFVVLERCRTCGSLPPSGCSGRPDRRSVGRDDGRSAVVRYVSRIGIRIPQVKLQQCDLRRCSAFAQGATWNGPLTVRMEVD